MDRAQGTGGCEKGVACNFVFRVKARYLFAPAPSTTRLCAIFEMLPTEQKENLKWRNIGGGIYVYMGIRMRRRRAIRKRVRQMEKKNEGGTKWGRKKEIPLQTRILLRAREICDCKICFFVGINKKKNENRRSNKFGYLLFHSFFFRMYKCCT